MFCFCSVQKELRELITANKEIDLDVFTTYTQTHHSLLFPAFQLQLLLRTKIMGTSFWENHCNRRVRLSNNKYIKIKDFIVLVSRIFELFRMSF